MKTLNINENQVDEKFAFPPFSTINPQKAIAIIPIDGELTVCGWNGTITPDKKVIWGWEPLFSYIGHEDLFLNLINKVVNQ